MWRFDRVAGSTEPPADDDNDGVSDTDDACPLDDDITCGQVSEPDLVVVSPSVSDASPEPAAPVTFTVTVHNQGAVTAHWTDAPRMRCTSIRLTAIWQPENSARFNFPHCPFLAYDLIAPYNFATVRPLRRINVRKLESRST